MTEGTIRSREQPTHPADETTSSAAAERAATGETVLNVGAGEDDAGDVTLDLLATVEPDVQGTATALPFADETFDVIEMDQVLEHVPPPDLGDVFEECHRVLREGGRLEAWVPHAASRLADQDPTHRSRWTYRTPEYFADGNFSWYYDDRTFDFDLVDREVTLWVLEDAPLAGVRSVCLRALHRALGWTDGLVYRPAVSGSVHFTLRKR